MSACLELTQHSIRVATSLRRVPSLDFSSGNIKIGSCTTRRGSFRTHQRLVIPVPTLALPSTTPRVGHLPTFMFSSFI